MRNIIGFSLFKLFLLVLLSGFFAVSANAGLHQSQDVLFSGKVTVGDGGSLHADVTGDVTGSGTMADVTVSGSFEPDISVVSDTDTGVTFADQ